MSVPNSGPERTAYVAAALAAVGVCPRGTVSRSTFHRPKRGVSPYCSKCGGLRETAHRYCRACKNAYARSTRPTHSELAPEARKRANIRRTTSILVARGKMDKTPCACGAINVTAVHHDWDDPWAVMWRCKACRSVAAGQGPIAPPLPAAAA